MNTLYAELEWLPQAPSDFVQRVKSLDSGGASIIHEIRTLAGYSLNLNQLIRLANAITKIKTHSSALDELQPFKLAILSNSTTDFIVPAVIASAARHGVALEVIQPSYDQVGQEALDPESKVNSAKPNAVLFALDYRSLPLKASPGDAQTSRKTLETVLNYLRSLSSGIKKNSNAICIFQTFAAPTESVFGSLDRSLPGTLRNLLSNVNEELANSCLTSGDLLFDVAALAETVGLADWHDTQIWNMGRFAFAHELVPLYADHVARILAAMRGKSRRVLVLDLDNTVWGGTVGDDGLQGIKIGQGDPIGEAHLAVQQLALDLRARGIVLAVCSKNSDEIARAPFQKRSEMLLKLDDIAVFQANWNDKATNIQAIASELSLGLDAMVFLDDNPAERGLVRALLPQVATPELPNEVAYYARTLAAAGYFETVAFVTEDLTRADYYQQNAKRANLHKLADGVDDYLASLDMTITFRPFDAFGRARIVQLINKSNQFNLTTRRYSSSEVLAAEADPNIFTLQAQLADIFGDNGIISVVICRPNGPDTWDIDTWLMSCRVLGRKVEHMILQEILQRARASGIRRLAGTYVPTGRNKLVVDHYAKLGFAKVFEDESGRTEWELEVQNAGTESAPMKVVSLGFAELDQRSLA